MKAMFSKTVLACAVAAASLFAGANVHAAPVYQDFKVEKPTGGTFTADKIVANYVERITFVDPDMNGSGEFFVSLFFDVEGFSKMDGTFSVDNTGVNSAYDLYGFYKASGTFGPSQDGTRTNFRFNAGESSSLQLFLDEDNTSEFAQPADGMGDWTRTEGDADVLLATGKGIRGSGNILAGEDICNDDVVCGSFGSVTTFNLTEDGSQFFVWPKPFYTLSFQRGQLNNFDVVGTQTINGSMDINFAVPEPASVGLLGLGLLGLSAARRRKQAK